jgi:hypothetical protein
VFRVAVAIANFVVSVKILDCWLVVKILGAVFVLNSVVIFKAGTRVKFIGALVLLPVEISFVLWGVALVTLSHLYEPETFFNSTVTFIDTTVTFFNPTVTFFWVCEVELIIGIDVVNVELKIVPVIFIVLVCALVCSVLLNRGEVYVSLKTVLLDMVEVLKILLEAMVILMWPRCDCNKTQQRYGR